jgi:hypothetical protein
MTNPACHSRRGDTTKWGASGQSSKAQPSRQIMAGRDILVLAFATIAMRISQSYR